MDNKMDYKRNFIEFMAEAGVLTFGDFVTKSGRKTPYFINTGNYKTGSQAARLGGFYADCIMDHIKAGEIDPGIRALFGPAYKGIPLAVSAAISLSTVYGKDLGYCFNRKERKDHGEGGAMVGHKLKDGDRILIIEDVITAGTAIRESLPILMAAADIRIEGLVVSVDRMERGTGNSTAIKEIYEEFGIPTYAIVSVRDIIDTLYGREIGGRILIDGRMKERMEAYLTEYCVL